jgi:hypothetical protein
VLGRGFSYELIEAVAPRPDRELQAALGQLVPSKQSPAFATA